MKSPDKFLIGIVAAVLLLVAAAFAVVITRPKPAYGSDDTPEGVVQNYLLAVQQGDTARAYGYLSPSLAGYPATLERFEEDIQDYSWSFRLDEESVSHEVLPAQGTGARTTVAVRETTFNQGGLFDSGQYTTEFTVQLRREPSAAAWKITRSDYYWAYCWTERGGC